MGTQLLHYDGDMGKLSLVVNEKSVIVSIETLMRPAAFRRGVDEVRAGIAPDFNAPMPIGEAWAYERGRQWALIAPRSMPLYINGHLNSKAVALFDRAYERGWITNETDETE
jgi:hypothetical protein